MKVLRPRATISVGIKQASLRERYSPATFIRPDVPTNLISNTSVPVHLASLKMVQVEQIEDYIGPFDLDVEGFNEDWWNPRIGRVGTSHHDWFSFTLDEQEVARAEIDYAAHLGGDYVGPPLPRSIIDIDFFEVRADRRGEGIGRQAVGLITSRYPDRLLTAFSEQADEFWDAIDWQRRTRVDGSKLHGALFVWDGRQHQHP